MDNLNYIFFEEFKHLDKLCGELYEAQNGVTHYIDDMKAVPGFEYRTIPNWNSDLQQLLRLRHIRNNLAHAEDAFRMELCTQEDIDWLRNFYQRILEQSDPMALRYQNAKKEKAKQIHVKNKENQQKIPQAYINSQMNRKMEPKLFYWIWIVLAVAVLDLFIFCSIILLCLYFAV